MSDINREAAGRALLPVLTGLLHLIDMLDSAASLDPETREVYRTERLALEDKMARAQAYFGPAERGAA